MAVSRALVLVNPVASRGRGKASAEAIRQALEAKGVSPEMVMLAGPDAVRQTICDHSGPLDAVVAVGGDGTLNAVVDAVFRFRPGVPVGLIPLGLANCMAGELGIAPDIDRAASVIAAGNTRVMDAAVVRDRLALAFWGAGFDARVAAGVAEHRTGSVRYGRYVRAAMRTFYRGETDKLGVEVDGRPIPGRYCQALLIQIRDFAHVFRFTGGPGFTLLLFRSGGRWALVRAAIRSLFLNRLERAADIAAPVHEAFRVWPEQGEAYFEFDGEAGGRLPAEGRILKGAIEYIVP